MEPRIYPFWEPKPFQELDPGLRQAVEAVGKEAMPANALQRALDRAGQIPDSTRVRRPWFRPRVVVTAAALAASLLLVFGVGAMLSSIPVGDGPGENGRTPWEIGLSRGTTDEERDRGLVLAEGNSAILDGTNLDVAMGDGSVRAIDSSSKTSAVKRTTYTVCTGIVVQSANPGKTPREGLPADQPVGTNPACCSPETYSHLVDNPFQAVAQNVFSTFATTVGTASYSDVRRCLLQDRKLPPPDAVRLAELINYFPYQYPEPTDQHPVALTLNMVECPWNLKHHLLRIALKGRENNKNQFLVASAREVKVQIEFNPQRISGFRPFGDERRLVKAEECNDDRKQGGTMGAAGHTVTALYEIIPAEMAPAAEKGEWLTVKLRYKDPDADSSKLLAQPLSGEVVKLAEAPEDVRFAAAVAGFGMLLRKTAHCGNTSFASIRELAVKAVGKDVGGHRAEFLEVIDAAEKLTRKQTEKAEGKKQ